MTTTTFKYTIHDGNPNQCSGSGWPAHDGEEIRGRSVSAVLDRLERLARSEARQCSDYVRGDRLWLVLCDEDGTEVGSRVITLDRGFPRGEREAA